MNTINVKIDRSIGYKDKYNNVYEINYGYVPGLFGGDGEEQDLYVISKSVNLPINEFSGKLVAIIYRSDDVETKWIVTGVDENITLEEIKEKTHFIEQHFNSTIFIPA